MCSSSGGENCIIQHLVSSHSVGGRPVHRFLSQPVHRTATYRCDDTRCCIVQFWLPMMSTQCSKHVEACNKSYYKTRICALIWLITKINSRLSQFCERAYKISYFGHNVPVCFQNKERKLSWTSLLWIDSIIDFYAVYYVGTQLSPVIFARLVTMYLCV